MTAERLFEILGKYAESQGIQLNKDKEYVMEILKGLLTNESRYGYRSCPCRLAAGAKEKDADIICPCVYRDPDTKDYGSCYCRLYVSKDWNEERIKHVRVPERRPRKD
ncbi:MAG TPA: ferredoxin-thioredoxin reductase catalytic domain-containing protein [Thermodesulfovibrionales bacterium]|jgi:ferredoxin-thioredoxin reductase catalytic chain|nr:ferredoxin-thioredoxin reductase catalytic domain-containing protein [Thermodesulfovibrionales bacterium]